MTKKPNKTTGAIQSLLITIACILFTIFIVYAFVGSVIEVPLVTSDECGYFTDLREHTENCEAK